MTTAQELQEQAERLIRSAKDDPDTELWAAPHPVPQEWSHADPEGTNGPDGEPQTPEAPDVDPYGWVAAVEDGRPTVEDSTGEQIQVRPHHTVVWTHGFPEPDKFDYAVAKVLPNGTLLVTLPGRNVPLKGYAPGVWLTFEHVGPEYQVTPKHYEFTVNRAKAKDMTMGVTYGGGPTLADQSDDGFTSQERQEWTERQRAQDQVTAETYRARAAAHADRAMNKLSMAPCTSDVLARKQSNDDLVASALSTVSDTQNLPKVEQAVAGGGAQAPKAPGVRADAGRTVRTPRPGTGVPAEDAEEKTSGWFRSLWQSLKNPDWTED